MVPQDDFSVFPSSSQHTSAPHLTHAEHTALMTLDLANDLKCWTHKCIGEVLNLFYPYCENSAAGTRQVLPRGPFPVGVSAEFRVHTSRTPPESPVRMSPVLRKTRHWTNFGFSYFYNTRNRVRNLLRLVGPVTCSTEVRSINRSNYNQLLNLNVLKRLKARIAMWSLVVVRAPAHQGALYTCSVPSRNMVTGHLFMTILTFQGKTKTKNVNSPQRFLVYEPVNSQSKSRRKCGTSHRSQ